MSSKLLLRIVVFSVFIYILTFASCGGGGGGGASLPDSQYSTHNPGGWGGNGGSSGGSSSGGSGGNNTISGGTPLTVTGYTYNGQTYPTVEALRDAIATDAFPYGTSSVDFTCTTAGGSTETRTARITKTADGNNTNISIEHQYKATTTVNGTDITIPFYKNDGISLADIAAAMNPETVGSGADAVTFDVQKVKIGGAEYPTNGTIPASAISGNGDVTINGAAPVYEKWGVSSSNKIQFSSSLNNGDSVTIGNVYISSIVIPSGKQISLNLNDAYNVSLDSGFITPPAGLTSITIPQNVSEITDNAFQNFENLESVIFPPTDISQIYIRDNAFENCTSLQSITLPNNIADIGQYAFHDCENLNTVTFAPGSTLTNIRYGAFWECTNLQAINIPASVSSLATYAFCGCENLCTITFEAGSSLSSIGEYTFNGCPIQRIDLPDSVDTIGANAFLDCENLSGINSDSSLDLSNVTSIGNYAFEGCSSITSVTLGNPTIGQDAFKDCTSLESITGRDNTFSLTTDAFAGCTNLARINVTWSQNITISSTVFHSLDSTKRVIIDLGSVNQAIPANNKHITLQDNGGTFAKTPHLTSNTIVLANHFTISGSTWGSRQIIVKPSTSFDYYTWNGTDFDTTSTAPAAWDD